MTRKNILSLAVAAALSAGGLAFAQDDKNAAERAADKTGRAAERAGDKIGQAAENTKDAAKNAAASWNVGRIHTLMTQVTEASLTKGGFDDLVERLVDADRNRIGKWMKDDANKAALDKLDGRIAQFQKDWKAKYNGDFDIKNDAQVFGTQHFQYAMGEIGKDAQVAGERLPGQQNVNTDNLNKKTDDAGNTVADKNLEKGRNVGYVTVKESHGMPELKVPLVHELPNNWRIDIPDSIDGQKLYDNLLKHLTMANEQKDQWPADTDEGYRLVAHHVLMALLDVDKDARQAGAKLGGDTATKNEK
jgi:hypothetical protein